MKAKDIMSTEVVTVPESATARDCIKKMLETGHHALPVVDASGAMVGLVTQTEILHLCLPEYADRIGDLAFLPDDFAPFVEQMQKVAEVRVGDIMLKKPATATEETAVVEVAALMVLRGFRTLPIVRDGKVVGIVGCRDLAEEILHPHA